jgi:hypothetical protein
MPDKNPNLPQWRFESIDIRAGMAIAFWREERRPGFVFHEHAPALFFSPPSFIPEPLGNPGIALSACRGMFAPGLYVDENGQSEVSFATPSDAAEFLRRAYVNGAAGDGGDNGSGGEPGPVPAPEGGGDDAFDLVLRELNRESITAGLAAEIALVAKWSDALPDGASRSTPWQSADGAPALAAEHASDVAALAASAGIILNELLARMPAHAQADAWITWYEDLRELGALLSGLGIAEIVLTDYLDARIENILVRHPEYLNHLGYDLKSLCWLLLFGPFIAQADSYADLITHLERLDYRTPFPLVWWAGSVSANIDDPLDTLSRLPLPAPLRSMFSPDIRDHASVYHLLNLVVSHPEIARRHDAASQATLGLALFAAACIAAPRMHLSHAGAPFALNGGAADSQRARRALRHGYAWLAEHLPRTIFSTRYEAIIGRTNALRYATPPPGTATGDRRVRSAGGVVYGDDVDGEAAQ